MGDRMSKWRAMDNGVAPSPYRKYDQSEKSSKKDKRRSRIIDPNEWVVVEDKDKKNNVDKEVAKISKSKEKSSKADLHKSISMGNLSSEPDMLGAEMEKPPLMSSAVAAWEQRPDGRKSADIFVSDHKKESNAVSKQASVKEESYEQMFEENIENVVPEHSSCDDTTVTKTEEKSTMNTASLEASISVEKDPLTSKKRNAKEPIKP